MSRPNIVKEIKMQGNLISGFGAFLGLGAVTIIGVNVPVLPTLMICGAMTPYIIDVLSLKWLIEEPKAMNHELWFLDKPFKKRVSKWISNYIDNSENLTEKKYKVGCLSLWMRHEGIELEKFVNKGIFRDLSTELWNQKEIKNNFPLQYLFGDAQKGIE